MELRAGSGPDAEFPIDVGVRDWANNGPGVEKVPKMAGDYRCVASGAGYDPEQDAQATAHGLSLYRRADWGSGLGAGASVGLLAALAHVLA